MAAETIAIGAAIGIMARKPGGKEKHRKRGVMSRINSGAGRIGALAAAASKRQPRHIEKWLALAKSINEARMAMARGRCRVMPHRGNMAGVIIVSCRRWHRGGVVKPAVSVLKARRRRLAARRRRMKSARR